MTRPNSRPQPTVRHQRNERGAIAAATAVVMGSMLVIASLVIDVGRDRVVSRDMQAMADVIALDVVRQLDGRPVESYGTLLTEAKNNSLKAQAGSLISLSNDEVEVEAVVANRDTGAWHTPANGEVPNAVWVHAIGHSAVRFLPSTAERTGIKRSALAMIGPPIACISAGATFAEIQQQGPLDTLLGKLLQNQGVDRLTVLDPYGLAALDMEIPLVDLAAKMGVGSVEEILTADISAHDFVLAISDVLPPKNDNKPNPVALLDAIVNGLPDTPGFRPGDILNLDTGGGTGTTLVINTFTLVQAVIMVSNKEHFVDLPLKVSVPGLAKVAVSAAVVEAPQIACGPVGTTAQSAQVRVRVSADVTALGGLVASAKIAPLEIMVGEGSGTITDIRCTAGSPSVAIQAKTAVGKLKLRLLTELLLGLTDLEVAVPDLSSKPDGAAIGSSTTHNMSFSFPTDDLPPGQTAGTTFGSLGLSSISPIKIDVIGLPVGGLLDGIVKPLLGIVDPLVSSLLRPILSNLGVNVGTVRIQPTARPSCNEPFLIQ